MPTSRAVPERLRRGSFIAMLLIVVMVFAGVLSHEGTAAAEDSGVVWERFDVEIDVREDGTMHITESQVITFDGQFSAGFAYIPLSHVSDIENVSVSVANSATDTPVPLDYVPTASYVDATGTYTYAIESGELAVDYAFEPTGWSGTEERLVVLEYDVIGGVRVYNDVDPANQQVWWYAVSQDVTDIAPVKESTVTITLPEVVPPDQLIAYPDNPVFDGRSTTWHRTNLGSGDEFEVSLQFPPITSAEVPPWQEQDDQMRQSREEAQERSDWAGFLLLVAGLIAAVGGGVAFLVAWFTRGRDPNIGLVAEYMETPPDDLRPGPAGVLLNETYHSRNVVATVLDLADRGVIKMEPNQDPKTASANAFSFTLLAHQLELHTYEKLVLDVIFGEGAKPDAVVPMPTIAGALASQNQRISDGYYQNLVEAGYFASSPESTRRRWKLVFRLIPFLILLAVVLIVIVADAWSGLAFFPIAVGIIFMIFADRMAKAMPRRSVEGAESAAKWRAFRAYLGDLQKKGDLENARQIFASYLPYAVAFGLAEEWVSRFARVYVPAPGYFGGGPLTGGGTVIITDGRRSSGGSRSGNWTQGPSSQGGGQSQGPSGSQWEMPTSMEDASGKMAGGLQQGSNSFWDMLGTVAKAFAESEGSGSGSFGSSRGGGFSGGGSRGGGSRGGGGGGGGGRRGFR